jgi:acyl dehydratase
MIKTMPSDGPAHSYEIHEMKGAYLEDLEVGKQQECGRFTLSEAEIIDFGRRFDPQPAHTDPEFAKGTPSGKVTASAAHSFAVAIGIFARAARECKVIAAVKIHGVELPAPLVADQPIRLLAQWKEKRESNSKPDRGIATWELEAVREDGTVVLRTSATILIRRRPAA